MAYIVPLHKPTSIRHALRMRLISPDVENLVIAKSNIVEVWKLHEEGLARIQSLKFHGSITMVQRLQPKGSETDLLFIGTEQLKFYSLAWDNDDHELKIINGIVRDPTGRYMRHALSQNKCLVDPTGRFLVMHLWEGVLNVFRLPTRKGSTQRLETLDQVRITELWIKSSTFIHSRTGHPRIAFLYKAQVDNEDARLAVYRLTKDDRGGEVSKFDPEKDRELDVVIPDPYSSMLIPIPVDEEKRYHVRNNEGARAHLGGLLVVGETLLTYFDSLTYASVSSPLKEPRIFVAWAEYDGTNFFLADDYGRLDMLEIETAVEPTGVRVYGMTLTPLHFEDGSFRTSRASSLVYMGDNLLFLASHHGDSELYRIDPDSRTIFPVQTMPNNAPILDFTIMDMGNREGDTQAGNTFSSGQTRIVAGCGIHHDGSLRSIRSGVGLKTGGILDDLSDTKGLFTLNSYGSDKVDVLVVSSVTESRVFKFDPHGGVEEVYSFQGLSLAAETLLAMNLPNGQVLQITPGFVILLDPESGITLSTWTPPDGKTITRASANSKWAFLSVDGTALVSLNLLQSLASQTSGVHSALPDQISCLHAARDTPDIGVVGWWTGSITFVDLVTMKPIHHGESLRQTSDSATVPRDIALVQLHPPEIAGPTLMVTMDDGTVVTFNVSVKGFEVTGRKSVVLGSSPARLHVLPRDDGTCTVFATTEHPSLIYAEEGKIIYSATTAEDATYVAPFDSEAFPGAIILSNDERITICTMDTKRLTHVKTLPVFETVRRVAYSPGLKAFGIGCIKKELVGTEEVVQSSFRLVDEILFEQLGKPFNFESTLYVEMVETVIRAELTDSGGNLAERFIVGTSVLYDSEPRERGTILGRIFVLGVDENRQVYQVMVHNLLGPCRTLAMVGEYIVAGLSKTVVVFSYLEETSSLGTIQQVAFYRPTAYPVDLAVSGNIIGVLDLMQSLSLVEFTPPVDGARARLEEQGRHFENIWGTAIASLDENRWLEADAQGNLLVVERNIETRIEADAKNLVVTSDIHLGEQVNKIRKLNVAVNENAIVSPRAFLGTTEGSIYLYGDISKKYQDLLIRLQSSLLENIGTPSPADFNEWRSFRTEARQEVNGPNRFVDGEFLSEFLRLGERQQDVICEGLGPSTEDVRTMIEELKRMS